MCHHSDVAKILSDSQFHALLVSETWMKPKLNSNVVAIPGYKLLRSDRNRTDKIHGGGVGIYIRDNLK